MTGNAQHGPSPEPAAAGPELVRVIRPGPRCTAWTCRSGAGCG